MKLRVFMASLALLGVAAIAPATAGALSCGTAGTITYYDGSNGTGVSMTLCATEYPASNEWCSLDQGTCRFTDGTFPDNRIQSSSFANAHSGTKIKVCTGYYFGGTCAIVSKPSSGGQIVNWGGIYYNAVSSFYSCGQDGCGDER